MPSNQSHQSILSLTWSQIELSFHIFRVVISLNLWQMAKVKQQRKIHIKVFHQFGEADFVNSKLGIGIFFCKMSLDQGQQPKQKHRNTNHRSCTSQQQPLNLITFLSQHNILLHIYFSCPLCYYPKKLTKIHRAVLHI